ncbi:hypothetical protein [Halorussus salinus]|uniref:hypothetical protein n=1 Tax=Halorussus salinus TaxID=1364935 RepID=UPI001092D936|nr:hypothetical protein [Halorussus salinus]
MNADRSRGRSFKWSLALLALVALSPAIGLYESGTVSWPWLVLGVVSWAMAAGPVAASRFGQRVGAWFRSIGLLGRAAVVFGFVPVMAVAMWQLDPPTIVVDSFLLGGMVGVMVVAVRENAASE